MSLRPYVPHAAAAVLFGVALATLSPITGEAHKAITSKYFYNEDVFPLFRERCGRCHVDGGVAPMSLMTYDDAVPWAESLRLELTADAVPAHHKASLSPEVLTAHELDLILVWATGGSPKGNASHTPPAVTLVNAWAGPTPDLVLTMPAPAMLPAATTETTHEVVLPIAGAGPRRLSAVDVLPGTPAIVRSATIALRTSATTPPKEIATWMPGAAAAVPLASPVAVPPGSALVVRFAYKRTWKYEGQALSDKSAVGLYFESGDRRGTGVPK